MTDSRYPRHQYALIDGERAHRIIYVAEEEQPDVWKESPADLLIANLKKDGVLKEEEADEEIESSNSPVTDVDQPSEPIGGTPASRRAAKRARKAAAKASTMSTPASAAEVAPGPDTDSVEPIATVKE